MNDPRLRIVAPSGLVIGAVLGMAGTFVASDSLRGLLWGLDGIALIVASALLTIHHFRRGHDLVAAGIPGLRRGRVADSGWRCHGSRSQCSPVWGRNWSVAASLTMVSASAVMPPWVRGTAVIAGLLFAVAAVQIFTGRALTPLSQPLPFFAYPFLAATLFGWAWVHYRDARSPRRP
jgi:hypothetical protein